MLTVTLHFHGLSQIHLRKSVHVTQVIVSTISYFRAWITLSYYWEGLINRNLKVTLLAFHTALLWNTCTVLCNTLNTQYTFQVLALGLEGSSVAQFFPLRVRTSTSNLTLLRVASRMIGNYEVHRKYFRKGVKTMKSV